MAENNTDWMIDLTNMTRIIREFNLQQDIRYIVDVKDCDLGLIGDLFVEPENDDADESKGIAQLAEIDKLYKYRKIEIIGMRHGIVYPEITIPGNSLVDCIRLTPFFLIKDTGKTIDKHDGKLTRYPDLPEGESMIKFFE